MVEPISQFLVYLGTTLFSGSAFGAALIMYAPAIAYGVLVAGSVAVGRAQQRKMENQAKNRYNSTLTDRTVMIRAASSPSPWAVGLSKLSGPIPFAMTTGAYNEYLHLVIALARHECDAIEAIYFGEEELPPENGTTGLIESGKYATTYSYGTMEGVITNGSGVATLSHTATSVGSVVLGGGQDMTVLSGWSHTPPSNTVTGLPASTVVSINYNYTVTGSYVRIKKHLGQPGQVADADLVAESGGQWTSSDKGTGVCYIYVRLQYNQDLFGSTGIPNITARVRGAKFYDPRKDSTAGGSGSHRVNDSTTWQWSQNPALASAAYLRDQRFGIRSANSEVIASELIAAANVCDEDVSLMSSGTVAVTSGSPTVTFSDSANSKKFVRPGMTLVTQSGAVRSQIKSITSDGVTATLAANYAGTTSGTAAYSVVQTRYLVDGALSSANSPWDNLEEILKSMAGSAVWVQGRWLLRAGAYEAPTLTLDETDLSGSAIEIVPRRGRKDLYNGVEGQYVNRSAGFVGDTYPAYTSSAFETEDGEQILTTINYDLVVDATACQRLGKISVLQSRQALTVKLTTNLGGYNLTPMGTVALTLARYGWSSKVFLVASRKFGLGGTIEHVLQETSSTVWNWSFAETAGVDPAPNTTLPDPTGRPSAPTGLSVAAGTAQLLVMSDGSIVSRAYVTWTASTDIFVRESGRVEIDWRLANVATWTAAGSIPGDSAAWWISPVPDATVIVVRVRFVSSAGKASDYAEYTIDVVGKSAAPSNVSGLAYSLISEGVRITWDQPADVDWDATELRIGASWAAGTLLFYGKATAFTWVNAAPANYTLWAAHYDTSDNVSATPQSISFTTLSLAGGSLVGHGNGMVIEGDTAYKVSSSGNWDGGVYTRQAGYGGARVRAIVGSAAMAAMIGLNANPATDANYTSIDYALYMTGSHYEIYESGGLIINTGVTQNANDVVEVLYNGTSVKYVVNGSLLYERVAPTNLILYGDSSFLTVGTNYKLYAIDFQPITPAQRGNLLNADTWVPGASSQDFGTFGGNLFTRAGDPATEDLCVWGTAPDGALRPVWQATSSDDVYTDASGAADGGFYTGNVAINPAKLYRFSVWVQAAVQVGTNGSAYLGPAGDGNISDIPTGANNTNPYFDVVARSNLVLGRWYLFVGYVLPHNYGTTAPSPKLGGVYDGITGERVQNASSEYKWNPAATSVRMRTYQYYSSNTNRTLFWSPRIEMCDGNEPTVSQLLAPAIEYAKLSNSYDNEFDAAFGLNGDFNRWAITNTYPNGWSLWANAGGISRETTTVASGPNAIRMVTGGNDTGIHQAITFAAHPVIGSYIEVTVAAYIVSSSAGANPQVLVRLYTNAGFTTYRDTSGVFSTNSVGWQNMTLNCAVSSGETIYGIEIFLMGSWTGGVGAWTGTVVFDKVFAKIKKPKDTDQLVYGSVTANFTSSNSGSGLGWTNSSSEYDPIKYGTRAAMLSEQTITYGARERYLVDIQCSAIFNPTGTVAINSVKVTFANGYRDYTSDTTISVGEGIPLRVKSYNVGSTAQEARAICHFTTLLDPVSLGWTIGHQYKIGGLVYAVQAFDASGSAIAPGSTASIYASNFMRVSVFKA